MRRRVANERCCVLSFLQPFYPVCRVRAVLSKKLKFTWTVEVVSSSGPLYQTRDGVQLRRPTPSASPDILSPRKWSRRPRRSAKHRTGRRTRILIALNIPPNLPSSALEAKVRDMAISRRLSPPSQAHIINLTPEMLSLFAESTRELLLPTVNLSSMSQPGVVGVLV